MKHVVQDSFFHCIPVGPRVAIAEGSKRPSCFRLGKWLAGFLVSGWAAVVAPLSADAAEWFQYLGPNGDSSTPESVRTNWAELPPRTVWRKPIGQGFSGITTGGGRIYTQAKRARNVVDRELCLALNADTGEEIWRVDVGAAQYTDLAGYNEQNEDGPRSTPTLDGEFVYVFNSYLKLFCLRADTGQEVWSRDFRAELSSQVIAWQNAASPLIVGDLIFLNVNAGSQRLLAVNKVTGQTVWRVAGGIMTHATPIFATIADVPQVIFLTLSGLASLDPLTGATLWQLPFSPSATSTASSPVVAGDYVHASSAYAYGTWVARLTRNGNSFTATAVPGTNPRKGNDYFCHWATPVHHEGLIYTIPSPTPSQAKLACFDPVGGTNRWSQAVVGSANIGFGSIIKAQNALIVFTEDGELVLVQPNPKAYTPIAKYKVLSRLCWNHVTLANGRIYARNSAANSEIVALDVAPPLPPIPALAVTASRPSSGNVLTLEVRAVDGGSLESGHAQQLEIATSPDLTRPATEWTVANYPWLAREGQLFAEIPLLDQPAQFVQVREKTP